MENLDMNSVGLIVLGALFLSILVFILIKRTKKAENMLGYDADYEDSDDNVFVMTQTKQQRDSRGRFVKTK